MSSDNGIEVRRLREGDKEAYSAFLGSHEACLIYYSLPYKALLENVLACPSEYWLALKEGRVRGVLPTMGCDGPFGRVINSLPFFGSHGGVLAQCEAASKALLEKFNELAVAPGVAAATMVENVLQPMVRAPAHDYQDDRIGQITDLCLLAGDEDEALRRLETSTRNNIRKALREGVEAMVDDSAVDFLSSLHSDNMSAIAGTPKPPSFFQKLRECLEPEHDYRIYVAVRAGKKIGTLLVFYHGETVEYITPAICFDARTYQPMSLLIWTAMRDALESGYTRWNWGGTWRSQKGVYNFKRKWIAEERVYRYFTKVNNPKVMSWTPAEVLRGYPYFFVVPFSELKPKRDGG